MDDTLRKAVEAIHASNVKAYIVTTGAGSRALAWLLGVPGASRTVLEALVPYSEASLHGFLGYAPEQHVSAAAARAMAREAYHRAKGLAEPGSAVAGVACTAAIVSDRPKKGDHRCHVAAVTGQGGRSYSLTLHKGARGREGEEEMVSRVLLGALAGAAGAGEGVDVVLAEGDAAETHAEGSPLARLSRGDADIAAFYPGGGTATDAPVDGAVLPGSFNPLHEGHEKLAEVASRTLGLPVTYELSMENVDKPPLAEGEILLRAAQFQGKAPLVVTRAIRFFEKARLFPGCTFVIGFDTATRLVSADYYGGDTAKMGHALSEIRRHGCRFLVAGRQKDGAFKTLDGIAVPEEFAPMFRGLPEREFRADVSSTELRARAGRTGG